MTDDISMIDLDTKRDGEIGTSGRSTNIGIHMHAIIEFPLGADEDVWRLCLTADHGVRAILIYSRDDGKYGPGGWRYLGGDEPGTDCTDFYYSGYLYYPDIYPPIWYIYLESYNLEGEGKIFLTWDKNLKGGKPATTIVPSSAFIDHE